MSVYGKFFTENNSTRLGSRRFMNESMESKFDSLLSSISPTKIKQCIMDDIESFYKSGSSNLYRKLDNLNAKLSSFKYDSKNDILVIKCNITDELSYKDVGFIAAAINKDIKDLTGDNCEIQGLVELDDYEGTESEVSIMFDVNLTKCIYQIKL